MLLSDHLRPMTEADWPSVERIYGEGIATGEATFESSPPHWEAFDRTRLAAHRWVTVRADRVVGWIAASPISEREVYRGVVEHSVYVAKHARKSRVGHTLLQRLVASTEEAGIWTIQSGIFAENVASVALHASLGFRVVGTRERIARQAHGPHAGEWRDVLLVERRSGRVGIDHGRTASRSRRVGDTGLEPMTSSV